MRLKLNIKIPSHSGSAIAAKVRPAVEAAFNNAKPKIAALIVDRVVTTANAKLRGQADAYRKAVSDPDAIQVDEHGVKVVIKDPAVLALDLGVQSFDIKAKMLPRAKSFAKDGSPYIDIPFSHRPYGKLFGGKDKVPKNVLSSLYKKANKVETDEYNVRSNAKGAPPKSFERTLTFGGKQVTTQVQHKAGIHDNMMLKGNRTQGSGKLTTIRRISGKSDPMSWWHPGFQGLGIFKKVFDELKRPINTIIGDSFRAVGLKARFK